MASREASSMDLRAGARSGPDPLVGVCLVRMKARRWNTTTPTFPLQLSTGHPSDSPPTLRAWTAMQLGQKVGSALGQQMRLGRAGQQMRGMANSVRPMRKMAVIGAGVTGVTTARALMARGFDVTVFDRHRYAAMETSFANGGQLSASNAEVWNSWGTVLKGIKWMFQRDAPLLMNPLADISWHKHSWMASSWRRSQLPIEYDRHCAPRHRGSQAARRTLGEVRL